MKASLKFLLHNTSPSILVALALGGLTVSAQQPHVAQLGQGFRCAARGNVFEVSAYATGILRVAVQAGGVGDGRTPVLDPAMHETSAQGLSLSANGSSEHIRTQKLQADFDCASDKLEVSDGEGHAIVSATGLGPAAAHQSLALHRSAADPMYGMAGLGRRELHGALERSTGAVVHAGTQGDGGAPFFFTKSFGLLIDSIDGKFEANGLDVTFTEGSRTELEFFVFVGPPLSTMSGLADLTGHAPMPPRWTLGFLNSQWGIDEEELKTLVGHYRASHIPLDGFILDYDWKAWGEDHFGEWRWNSTSGAGNDQPDRFPDGASGALGREMKARGVHLAGILKPRILLYKAGTSEFTDEAAYADAHHFWLPGEGKMEDMGTHRPAQDIDFAQPAAREWFWKHLEPAFDAGMAGWWNDEADEAPLADKSTFHTNSMEFFSMGRALYEGQRGHSQARVWSLNRNFYLGAQRFGYAEWSGDIATGAETMAAQPVRMLATLNLGEPHWSMDTGGFFGNPTSEEYARWVEFAAFTPILRVHASHDQKRQPWVFGPVAEAAAAKAIRLRYSLLPYIYSAERTCFESGIGVARPLEWIFPEDATAAQQTDEWMFGHALLVAPVLDLKSDVRKVYLPAGGWLDYATGKRYPGQETAVLRTDARNWADLPLFVREGSILASEEPGDDTDAMHPAEITLDVFPSRERAASFTAYEDDGATYQYEKGAYRKQSIRAAWTGEHLVVELDAPEGNFAASVRTYLLRVHVTGVAGAAANGGPAWTVGEDRFGKFLERRVKAGVAARLDLAPIR